MAVSDYIADLIGNLGLRTSTPEFDGFGYDLNPGSASNLGIYDKTNSIVPDSASFMERSGLGSTGLGLGGIADSFNMKGILGGAQLLNLGYGIKRDKEALKIQKAALEDNLKTAGMGRDLAYNDVYTQKGVQGSLAAGLGMSRKPYDDTLAKFKKYEPTVTA